MLLFLRATCISLRTTDFNSLEVLLRVTATAISAQSVIIKSMVQAKRRRWRLLLLAGFVILLLFFGYGILASRGTFVPLRPAQEAGGSSVMVGVPGHRIAGRVYVMGAQSPDGGLVG